jgi:hypothetical protein
MAFLEQAAGNHCDMNNDYDRADYMLRVFKSGRHVDDATDVMGSKTHPMEAEPLVNRQPVVVSEASCSRRASAGPGAT